MAEPMTIIIAIIKVANAIREIAVTVQSNVDESTKLANKVQTLVPLLQPLQSLSDEELQDDPSLPTLRQLQFIVKDAEKFIRKFMPKRQGLVKQVVKLSHRITHWKSDKEILQSIYDDLNATILQLCAFEIIHTKQLVFQKGSSPDSLESLFQTKRVAGKDVLGRGVLGVVLRKTYTITNRDYAVKVINLKRAEEDHGVTAKQLENECNTLARLTHEHIARYFISYYSRNNSCFSIVMELMEGGTLADQIGRVPPVDEAQVWSWLEQLASALCYMHRMNVLHRDLKPENVVLTADNKVKVVDMGLARTLTASGRVGSRVNVGSTMYASYEKSTGVRHDGRDDLWALGIIVLELLISERLKGPFVNPSNEEAVHRRADLLRRAEAISSSIGGGILPFMLEPEQVNRLTSQDLVDRLQNRAASPLARNIPAVPALECNSEADIRAALGDLVAGSDARRQRAAASLRFATAREGLRAILGRKDNIDLLVLVLRHSRPDVQANVAHILRQLVQTAQYRTAFIATAEGFSQVAHLLRNGNPDVQSETAGIVQHLSENSEMKKRILAANILPTIVELIAERSIALPAAVQTVKLYTVGEQSCRVLLDAGATSALMNAVAHEAALVNLAGLVSLCNIAMRLPDSVPPISTAVDVDRVLFLLRESSEEVKERAAGLLWIMAMDKSEGRRKLADTSAVLQLCQYMQSATSLGKQRAAGALWHLAAREQAQRTMIDGQIIQQIALLLSDPSQMAAEQACGLLRILCKHQDAAQQCFEIFVLSRLVAVLRKGSAVAKEEAAFALGNLSRHESCRSAILTEGAVPPLIRLLCSTNPVLRGAAASVIAKFSRHTSLVQCIVDGGVISPLTSLLRSDQGQEQVDAVVTLTSLVALTQYQKPVADAGAIPLLVEILKSGSDTAKDHAVAALGFIAQNPDVKSMIRLQDAVPVLVQLLHIDDRAKSHPELHHTNERVAQVLRDLCGDVDVRTLVAEAGAAKLLTRLMCTGSLKAHEQAVAVLYQLSEDSSNLPEIGEASVTQLLVHLTKFCVKMGVREHAAGILHRLSALRKYAAVMAAEGAIAALLQLSLVGTAQAKLHAVGALRNITALPEYRLQVVGEGGIQILLCLICDGTEAVQVMAVEATQNLACDWLIRGAIKGEIELWKASTATEKKNTAELMAGRLAMWL